jgi:hypothetical protein
MGRQRNNNDDDNGEQVEPIREQTATTARVIKETQNEATSAST